MELIESPSCSRIIISKWQCGGRGCFCIGQRNQHLITPNSINQSFMIRYRYHTSFSQIWKMRFTPFSVGVSITTSNLSPFTSLQLLIITFSPDSSKLVESRVPFSDSQWQTCIFTPYICSNFFLPNSIWYFTEKSLPCLSVQSIATSMIYVGWLRVKEQLAFAGGWPTSYLQSQGRSRHLPKQRAACMYELILKTNEYKEFQENLQVLLLRCVKLIRNFSSTVLAMDGGMASLVRLFSLIWRISFRSYIFCKANITLCPFAICQIVLSAELKVGGSASSCLRCTRPMLRAVIMCLRRMWLTTIQNGNPFGYGYFYRISGIWLLERQVCCMYLFWAKNPPWLMLRYCSSVVVEFRPCCTFLFAMILRQGRSFLFFPPMTVLKNQTISSFWPSSFWIIDKNSPNSIFPDLSSSTESMSALISSRVSNRPTEKSSSQSQSMPIEPDFFSSSELKYCFISLLS